MKKSTLILILAAIAGYIWYKSYRKNGGTSQPALAEWTAPEPLYADDYKTGQTYYIPAGARIKDAGDYYEVWGEGSAEPVLVSKV